MPDNFEPHILKPDDTISALAKSQKYNVQETIWERMRELTQDIQKAKELSNLLWLKLEEGFGLPRGTDRDRLALLQRIKQFNDETYALEIQRQKKLAAIKNSRELTDDENDAIEIDLGKKKDESTKEITETSNNEPNLKESDGVLETIRIRLSQLYRDYVKTLHPDTNGSYQDSDVTKLTLAANFRSLVTNLFAKNNLEGLQKLEGIVDSTNDIIEALQIFSNEFDNTTLQDLRIKLNHYNGTNINLANFLVEIKKYFHFTGNLSFEEYYSLLLESIEDLKDELSELEHQFKAAKNNALARIEANYAIQPIGAAIEKPKQEFVEATTVQELEQRIRAAFKKVNIEYGVFGERELARNSNIVILIRKVEVESENGIISIIKKSFKSISLISPTGEELEICEIEILFNYIVSEESELNKSKPIKIDYQSSKRDINDMVTFNFMGTSQGKQPLSDADRALLQKQIKELFVEWNKQKIVTFNALGKSLAKHEFYI